jgi:hypothetical protein
MSISFLIESAYTLNKTTSSLKSKEGSKKGLVFLSIHLIYKDSKSPLIEIIEIENFRRIRLEKISNHLDPFPFEIQTWESLK